MVKHVAGSEPSLDISSYGIPPNTVRQLYLQLIEYIYDLITPPSTPVAAQGICFVSWFLGLYVVLRWGGVINGN